jgi:hypothetical protein
VTKKKVCEGRKTPNDAVIGNNHFGSVGHGKGLAVESNSLLRFFSELDFGMEHTSIDKLMQTRRIQS